MVLLSGGPWMTYVVMLFFPIVCGVGGVIMYDDPTSHTAPKEQCAMWDHPPSIFCVIVSKLC